MSLIQRHEWAVESNLIIHNFKNLEDLLNQFGELDKKINDEYLIRLLLAPVTEKSNFPTYIDLPDFVMIHQYDIEKWDKLRKKPIFIYLEWSLPGMYIDISGHRLNKFVKEHSSKFLNTDLIILNPRGGFFDKPQSIKDLMPQDNEINKLKEEIKDVIENSEIENIKLVFGLKDTDWVTNEFNRQAIKDIKNLILNKLKSTNLPISQQTITIK